MPSEYEQEEEEEEEDWPDLLPGLGDEKETAGTSTCGGAANARAQGSADDPYDTGPLAGVTPAQVDVCVKVLQAIRSDIQGFVAQGSQKGERATPAQRADSKAPWDDDCRALRKQLMPLVERLSKNLYAGRSPEQYKGDRWLRKQERGKDAQARAMDARRINGTRLRNARLVALQKLQEQPGDVPLIPDGAVAADAEVGGTLADGAAGAVPGGWAAYYAGISTRASGQGLVEEEHVGGATDPAGSARSPQLELGPEPEPRTRTEAVFHPEKLAFDRSCYICKARYRQLHHFYDQLCPACAELNWRKRTQSARLEGRVALVTGGRVKIGFQVVLKLLRAGARVIVTSRFPVLHCSSPKSS
jgi:3-oxoacyl-ACP reductase-like protein